MRTIGRGGVGSYGEEWRGQEQAAGSARVVVTGTWSGLGVQGFCGAFQKQRRAGAARPGRVELEALETQVESSYYGASQQPGAHVSSTTGMLGPATRPRRDRRGPVALRDRPTRRALAAASLLNSPSCIGSLRSGGPAATEGGQQRGCMLRATRLVARPSCSNAQSWQRAVPCMRLFWRPEQKCRLQVPSPSWPSESNSARARAFESAERL